MQVTITKKQRKQYTNIGVDFLKKHLISGFQLEDFNPHKKEFIYYGHDNPKHIQIIRNKIGGSAYPRLSYYKWHKGWKLGKNTSLFDHKKYAKAKELYLANKHIGKSNRYFNKFAIHGFNEIPYSWDVPDIRIFGRKTYPHYKTAYFITKNIDKNSRFATLSTNRSKVNEIKKRLTGEKVQKVLIQNYKPKNMNHSFYNFIHSIS